MNNNQIIEKYLYTLGVGKVNDLKDIAKLLRAHLKLFAFCSMRVLLKEEISLDLKHIYENIVKKRRGGYCFEHNKLIYECLKYLGFDVKPYLARVVNNTDAMPPKTHRFTVLNYEKKMYLIDLGIGFRSPSVPVEFGGEPSVSHLGVEYKIISEDKGFAMQLIENGKPYVPIKFDLKECYEGDFELSHFYSHKHPDAVFVNNLIVSCVGDDGIYSFRNGVYFKVYQNSKEEIIIKNKKQFETILMDDFNLNFTSKEVGLVFDQFLRSH